MDDTVNSYRRRIADDELDEQLRTLLPNYVLHQGLIADGCRSGAQSDA